MRTSVEAFDTLIPESLLEAIGWAFEPVTTAAQRSVSMVGEREDIGSMAYACMRVLTESNGYCQGHQHINATISFQIFKDQNSHRPRWLARCSSSKR